MREAKADTVYAMTSPCACV